MAYFDYIGKKEPSKFRRFIWAISSDWWDDLWWEKHSHGKFGGEYCVEKTFKTGNLALVIAIVH